MVASYLGTMEITPFMTISKRKIVSVTCHSIWLEQMDAWVIPVSEGLIDFYRSFVIVHTEHDQWQVSLRQEKSACLTEVSSVTGRF